MSYSRAEISEFEKKIGKSQATLFRWAKQGCDLRDANSVQAWVERNRLRETNIAKSRRRRGFTQKASSNVPRQAPAAFKPQSKRLMRAYRSAPSLKRSPRPLFSLCAMEPYLSGI